MIDIDWKPDREKLRQFGWISLGGFGVIGGVLGWKFGWFAEGEWLVPAVLWGIGVLAALLSLVEPLLLKPLYLVLTAISAVIGPIVATVVMGVIFYLVFLPLGLIFRLAGRDELQRRLDPEAKSYWIESPGAQPPERYFRQY